MLLSIGLYKVKEGERKKRKHREKQKRKKKEEQEEKDKEEERVLKATNRGTLPRRFLLLAEFLC